MKKKLITLCAALLSLSLAIVIWEATSKRHLMYQDIEALADEENPVSGTCCPKEGSVCVAGSFSFSNYAYLESGTCK